MDDLNISSRIASHGMKAQATRLRVISENLANMKKVRVFDAIVEQ